jgi:hypothetical protein
MADSEKNVSYGVSADASPFEQGMQRAADSARGAAGNIESNFRKVQDAFAQVQKQLLLLAGIVAGGAFFKDAINASNQLTAETLKLSRALGINAEQAGTLRTALEDIGSSGDDYVETFTKFARQIKSNEDGLKAMGLQTRDANGNLRDSNELFTEALRSVGQYKAGLDQSTYAQTVFGKSIDNVMKLQKLNNDVLDEAKKKNQELGLVVTKDNVEASKAYKLAMHDVDDVLTAVKKTIGDAVMPVFTELGKYFASTGPYVVEVFKGAMMGLLTVFEVVKGAVKTVAGAVFEAFNLIVDGAGLIGEVFAKLFQGDFSGAYEAAKKVGQRTAQAFSNAFSNFVDAGNDTGDAVKKHFNGLYGDKTAADAPKGGSKRMGDFKATNGKEQSRVAGWEADLAEQKLKFQEKQNAAGTFYQFSKQQELAFWKDKLNIQGLSEAESIAMRRKSAEVQLAINTDVFNHEVGALQAQEAAYKQNMDAKLALLDREAALVKQRYGQESKEYEEVQKKIIEAKRQATEQIKQIDLIRADSARDAQLAALQLAEQEAQLEFDMRSLTAQQLLGLESQFEDRRFQVAAQALRERLELLANDPDRNTAEMARLHAEIEDLERQHQARMGQIRNQQILESTAASRRVADATTTALQDSLSQMLQGTMTFAKFFQSIWQSVRAAVANELAKMVVDYIKNTVVMAAIKRAFALFDIGANAAQAGSGAAASAAEIPVVGWIMAPLAAAATFAMASGYGNNMPAFSAAGGFDIPGSINPLVQTHANEMVLPAKHADVIRRLADQGDAQRQSAPPTEPSINVTKLHGDFFMIHRAELARAMMSARRDFLL